MKKYPKFLLLFVAMGLLFTSCSNDDNILPDYEQEEPETEEPKTVAEYPVQNFMWQTMNAYYFWQAEVPNLADDKFSNFEDPNYVAFLASQGDPEKFFYEDLCDNHKNAVDDNAATDRFSFVSENYKDLVNSLQGVSKSNGLEFTLYVTKNDMDIYGVVNYVLPNSDASTKDIQRGDIFTGVNGQNLNRSNYIELLFGNEDTYTLNLAEVDGQEIKNIEKDVSLTKEENFSENPIFVNKIIEQGGQKIGYLMYNGFLAAYDDQLNDAFGEFKAEGIKELILDFRYNGGGRVSSAVQMASSVYGTQTEELFLKARYNERIESTFESGDGQTNFTDMTFESEAQINALNLSRVYVIATGATASASELVMNGLAPYVDVIHVGTKTVGKSEFSNTFVDDPENGNFYEKDREEFINPENQWGLQPLLGKNENADGFSGYETGLIPDFEVKEDIKNLGVLGDENERMLAFTLSVISGETAKMIFDPALPTNYLTNSKMFKPAGNNMFMDGLIKPVALTSAKKIN